MNHEHAMQMIAHNEEVFEVRKVHVGKHFTAFWVFYPNCPRGEKIMVFRNSMAPQKPYKLIRPHFGEEGSPVVRYEPTENGWNWALDFVNQERCPECCCELSACGEIGIDGCPTMDCPLCILREKIKQLEIQLWG